jgi:lysophospholipase L1-like esterase
VDTDSVRVVINHQGWHDQERKVAKTTGTLRIAVLGDSFVEGYSVNADQAFPHGLEARLRNPPIRSANGSSLPVEVLSFGVGGYGTLQELLVYRDEIRRYQPDLVLLGFCVANDVRNNSRELESVLDGSPLEMSGRPYLVFDATTERWRLAGPEQDRRTDQVPSSRRILGSARRSVLVKGLLRLIAAFTGPTTEQNELAVHGVHFCNEPPEYEWAWRVTGELLRRLRDEVAADGARLVVFSEPTYRETADSARRRVEARSSDPGQLCLDEAPGFTRLGDLLATLGIPYVDLLSEFRRQEPSNTLFRRADHHWNRAGNQLVAAALAREARERLWLVGNSRVPGPLEPAP